MLAPIPKEDFRCAVALSTEQHSTTVLMSNNDFFNLTFIFLQFIPQPENQTNRLPVFFEITVINSRLQVPMLENGIPEQTLDQGPYFVIQKHRFVIEIILRISNFINYRQIGYAQLPPKM